MRIHSQTRWHWRDELEPLENGLERLAVLGAERLISRGERLLFFGELTDRACLFEEIAEHIEFKVLICHNP